MTFIKKTIYFLQSKTPGARTLKTGLAVAISMLICELLKIPSPILAGAATISNMQPGTGESIQNAKDQALAHLIAIFTAIVLGVLFGPGPLVAGLAAIIIITICINLKIETSIHVAIIAAIFIIYSPANNYLFSALQRAEAVFIGILIAFLVNVTILPPENEKRLKEELAKLHTDFFLFFEDSLENYLLMQETSADEFAERYYEEERKLEEVVKTLESFKAEIEFRSSRKEEREKIYDKYLNYQRIILKNIADIYSLSIKRRERMAISDQDIFSEYVRKVNKLIGQLYTEYKDWDQLLAISINGQTSDLPEFKDSWGVFNEKIISQYEYMSDKKGFIPVIIEASIIMYKLRWATEDAKNIIDALIQEGEFTDDQS